MDPALTWTTVPAIIIGIFELFDRSSEPSRRPSPVRRSADSDLVDVYSPQALPTV
jgi:hypothetical protein